MTETIGNITATNHMASVCVKMTKCMLVFTTSSCLHCHLEMFDCSHVTSVGFPHYVTLA